MVTIKTILVCPPESYEGLSVKPEMLAAISARISRNGDGLDELMETVRKIKDPTKIFRFIDYGHGSIEGLTGQIALFFEGISILEMEKLFEYNYCYEGQETSTRYVEFSDEGVLSAADIGISSPEGVELYNVFIREAFQAYHKSVEMYQEEAKDISFTDDDPKKRKRYERNWVFDKVRYLIPVTSKTSGIMMMTPRDWAQTAKIFYSMNIKIFTELADKIVSSIRAITPNLCRHTTPDEISINTFQMDHAIGMSIIINDESDAFYAERKWQSYLLTNGNEKIRCVVSELTKIRKDRYDILHRVLDTTSVDYVFQGITFAELRDVNRMRSGGRLVDMCPEGLTLPDFLSLNFQDPAVTSEMKDLYSNLKTTYKKLLKAIAPEGLQWFAFLLGTQVTIRRTNTLRKTAYAIELRTGIGANTEYAKFYRVLGEKIQKEYGFNLLMGTAEPEVV